MPFHPLHYIFEEIKHPTKWRKLVKKNNSNKQTNIKMLKHINLLCSEICIHLCFFFFFKLCSRVLKSRNGKRAKKKRKKWNHLISSELALYIIFYFIFEVTACDEYEFYFCYLPYTIFAKHKFHLLLSNTSFAS